MESLPLLEHLRRRLGWRKWYRNVGFAYVRPIRSDRLEADWLRANRLPRSANTLRSDLRRLLVDGLNGDDTDTPLARSIVDTILLQHYQRYVASDACTRFRLWYGNNLAESSVTTTTSSSSSLSWLDRAINDYVSSYFAATYRTDTDVRAIDDSSLWYFSRCSGVTMRELQEILTLPTGTSTISWHVLLAGRRRRRDGGDGDGGDEKNRAAIEYSAGIRIVDQWRWRVGELREKPVRLGWVRLAPLAAAVVEHVTRLRGENVTTLPTDYTEPSIDRQSTNDDGGGGGGDGGRNGVSCGVFVTNLMVHDPPADQVFRHDDQTISVFLQPDQDPMITHVLDPFADSLSTTTTPTTPLRWVVVHIYGNATTNTCETSSTKLDLLERTTLLDLLGQLSINDASVDSQLSRLPPDELASPRAYSGTIVPRNVTMRDMVLKYLPADDEDAVMLHAHPRVGQYAPTASSQIFQSRPGLVPFSVNEPRAFTFGAHTLGAKSRERVSLSAVSVLVQGSTDLGWLVMNDPREIREFFARSVPTVATLVRTLRDPPPVTVRVLAKKRVFALADGTVFVSLDQLMIPGDSISVDRVRFAASLDELPTVLRPHRIVGNRSFARASLAGSLILFPLRGQLPRSYDRSSQELAPIVEWLDESISGKT